MMRKTAQKSPLKKRGSLSKSHFIFFYPLHETNFCTSIKLSVVSVAPQTHSQAPKYGARKRKRGETGRAGQTVGECVKVSPWCCSHYVLLGMETWTFYNKSLIIFYSTPPLILSPHVSGIYITAESLEKKSSVLSSAGRGAAAYQPTSLS